MEHSVLFVSSLIQLTKDNVNILEHSMISSSQNKFTHLALLFDDFIVHWSISTVHFIFND